MPTWNATFVNTDDWSAQSFLQMFLDAIHERWGVTSASGLASWTLSVGDDVQNHTFISQFQDWIRTNCTRFTDPTLALNTNQTDHSGRMLRLTFASLRSQAGITGSDFRRLKPREITNAAATNDTDGNAPSLFALAWNRATSELYTYNGSNWVLNTTGFTDPDILDSDNAAPNTTSTGSCTAGDYIGPHLWTQIRDCLNKLTVVAYSGRQRDPSETPNAGFSDEPTRIAKATAYVPNYSNPGPGNDRSIVSFAALQGFLASDWSITQVGSAEAFNAVGFSGGTIWDGTALNSVWAPGGRDALNGVSGSFGPAIKADLYYYAYFGHCSQQFSSSPSTGFIFDPNGVAGSGGSTPVNNSAAGQPGPANVNGTHTYMGKSAGADFSTFPATGTTVAFPLLSSYGGTTLPNAPPDPSSAGPPNAENQGYTASGLSGITPFCSELVADFKVAGGFVFV